MPVFVDPLTGKISYPTKRCQRCTREVLKFDGVCEECLSNNNEPTIASQCPWPHSNRHGCVRCKGFCPLPIRDEPRPKL